MPGQTTQDYGNFFEVVIFPGSVHSVSVRKPVLKTLQSVLCRRASTLERKIKLGIPGIEGHLVLTGETTTYAPSG